VSWQLVSFAIVLASLGLAFWWYERSHPPAKLLAVVATLAAIAALGRDAFAAVPDVKPITAIVLVSGIAFGAGPGFAVGAISGFASNFLLGQGPWTPWQMLGWGLVGLIGGGLGGLTSRRMSSLQIALACAVTAEVFNLVVDLYTWTSAGDQTLRAFGLVLASAVVFDLTHVLASFGFGLAFGGALLRMLTRVRSRLEVSWERPREGTVPSPSAIGSSPAWQPTGTLLLTILAVAAGTMLVIGANTSARASTTAAKSPSAFAATASQSEFTTTATSHSAHAASLSPEISFLTSAQSPDGGFGAAKGQSSSELYTAWTAMGLAAAGRNPATVRRDGHSVLDSLRAEVSTLSGLGDAERTILAAAACGATSYSFAGRDLVSEVLSARDSDNSFEHLVNLTAFAIFALRAVGHSQSYPAIRDAAGWIEQQQNSDGGFGFGGHGSPSDVDDTGAALQALVDAGARNAHDLAVAADYLIRSQNLDGGFPQEYGSESNAQSTAWAVQGLIAAGRNPNTVRRRGSRSPLGYLESLLAPGGSIRYSRTSAQTPVWVTAQALIALAGRTFPVGP
jgi:energy-coupling factor transport system substrate-specific component